jgi:hypothetical protein
VDARPSDHRDHSGDFFKRQQFSAGHERDFTGRHAVEASDVAPVGHANPKAAMNSTE